MDGHSVNYLEESGLAQDQRLVTIDVLPDDVLVEMFDFYLSGGDWSYPALQDTWDALVHVCHRWRDLVFASPRRLNLRLEYQGYRPMSEVPDAWRTSGGTTRSLHSIRSTTIASVKSRSLI